MRLPGGIHAPHYKNTADMVPERLPTPSEIVLPMSMGIGAPAKPVVKAGDTVKVGQLVAEPGGFVSSPIYSGVSGTVKAVGTMLGTNGASMSAVTITPDGEQSILETIAPPDVHDLETFQKAVRDSGVVGLGGAGFPTSVKLTVKDLNAVECVLVNGAECEPYITSDTRTMLDDTDDLIFGVELIKKYMLAKRVVFGIEKNKPKCIEKIREAVKGMEGVEVEALPSNYPQGGEKVLIYNITGKMVPEGKLPLDVGAVVINCTTLAAIAKYIKTGMPLVEKCVTIDGSAVNTPKNVIAPIGTPLKYLFDFCGGFKCEAKKVLYGGPMMGIAVDSLDAPVLKTTNASIALNEKDAIPPESTSCIRCGRCVDHCPMRLMPLEIETAFQLNKPELLEKYKVNLCMECGCCSFGCPAKRPLVQTMKLSKNVLRVYQAKKKAEAEAAEAKKKESEAK